jgi:hypothetical protein
MSHGKYSRALTFQNFVFGVREVAHKLCPDLVLNMHKSKFEEWVRKLGNNKKKN